MQCPLTGKPCTNPKTIHFTKVVNDKSIQMDLCEQCAGSMMSGFVSLPMVAPAFGNLFSIFNQLIGGIPHSPSLAELSSSLPCCSGCKCSLQDIIQAGRMGCPECYERFHDQLLPMLERHHQGATKHEGKHPKYQLLHNNLNLLKKQLKDAVDKEEYEKAAALRDRINKLTQKADED